MAVDIAVVFLLLDFSEHTGYLVLEEFFQLLQSVFVQVVLLTELNG